MKNLIAYVKFLERMYVNEENDLDDDMGALWKLMTKEEQEAANTIAGIMLTCRGDR